MHFRSITLRLLVIIGSVFLLTLAGIYSLANSQFKRIIDESQESLYREKLTIISNELILTDERLRDSGNYELNKKKYQNSVLEMLSRSYYSGSIRSGFPVILDSFMQIVLHPSLPAGTSLKDMDLPESTDIPVEIPEPGQINTGVAGEPRWYVYEEFDPWEWLLIYSVPLSEKYRDLRRFRIMILMLFLMSMILFFPFLLIALLRATGPITELTEISRRIASGILDDPIPVKGRDETAILADSFRDMQISIRERIEDLNREIREREKAEQELFRANDFISSIIESMPSVLICVDTTERVTHWNSRAAQLTGIKAADAVGMTLSELFPDLDPDALMIQTGIDTGEAQFFPQRAAKVDDKTLYYDITVYPVSGSGVKGAVIRVDDVTEKTVMEEHLLQASKMDAIGQLAGGVAHDFNNMLGGITGAASLLKLSKDLEGSEDLKYLELILEASKRAADLTSRLLTFGRQKKFDLSNLDLHRIVEDSLSLLERTIDRKVRIVTDFKAESTLISGDAAAVQNAVLNLAINGSHAMKGDGTLTIATKNVFFDDSYCRMSPFNIEPGNFINLTVSDTGEGIPCELMSKIFEPFFTTKGMGTGLGLSSVYGTMQDHNGAVKVYSEPGNGSVFHLSFPCIEQMEYDLPVSESSVPAGSGTILFADDEEIIRLTVKALLERMGYSVLLAEDGAEAVDLFKKEKERISLVITDMIMPNINGREVFYSVRKIKPGCPVVISSGFTRDENFDSLFEEGLAGFIQKPYLNDELAELLDRVLRFRE